MMHETTNINNKNLNFHSQENIKSQDVFDSQNFSLSYYYDVLVFRKRIRIINSK